jgi:hypothetical protein
MSLSTFTSQSLNKDIYAESETVQKALSNIGISAPSFNTATAVVYESHRSIQFQRDICAHLMASSMHRQTLKLQTQWQLFFALVTLEGTHLSKILGAKVGVDVLRCIWWYWTGCCWSTNLCWIIARWCVCFDAYWCLIECHTQMQKNLQTCFKGSVYDKEDSASLPTLNSTQRRIYFHKYTHH